MWEIQARILKSKRVAATAVGFFPLAPQQIWDLLTLPEGADLFRVEGRVHSLDNGHGLWKEEVVFTAAVRVLFWKSLARTRVHQTIDVTDPTCVRVNFRLMHSDLMAHLQGSWELKQVAAVAAAATEGGGGQQCVGPIVTKVTYTFEMWPKGVPTALRFMPGLMSAVKDAVKREAAQLLDKVHYVAGKVQPGVPLQQALLEAAAEVAAAGGSFKLLQQTLAKHNATTATAATASAKADSSSTSGSPCIVTTAAAAAPLELQCHALLDNCFSFDGYEQGESPHSVNATSAYTESSSSSETAELDSSCYSGSSGSSSSSGSTNVGGSMNGLINSLRISDSSSGDVSLEPDGACVIMDGSSSTTGAKAAQQLQQQQQQAG